MREDHRPMAFLFCLILFLGLVFTWLGSSLLAYSDTGNDRDYKRVRIEVNGMFREVYYKVEALGSDFVEKYYVKDEKSLRNDFVVYGYVERADPEGNRYVVWVMYENYCPTDEGSWLEDIIRENPQDVRYEILEDIIIRIDQSRHSSHRTYEHFR